MLRQIRPISVHKEATYFGVAIPPYLSDRYAYELGYWQETGCGLLFILSGGSVG